MLQPFRDAVTVDNPAEILRNQIGVFEVVSPYGLVFQVTCQPGTTMKMREVSHPSGHAASHPAAHSSGPASRNAEPVSTAWRIRKVSSGIFV
jgi:hypothetical protein